MTDTLKSSQDFARVFDQGGSLLHRLLVCRALAAAGKPTRVGLVVSRKFGSAVARNRLRRRLREVVRLNAGIIPDGWDLVLLPRGATKEADFASLTVAFQGLMDRLTRLGASGGGKSGVNHEDSVPGGGR